MRLSPLVMLVLAACPEPEPTGVDPDPEPAACTNGVREVMPQGEILYTDALVVTLVEAEESATAMLLDSSEAEVASTVQADGNVLTLTPDGVLEPASTYTLVIETCAGQARSEVSTSEAGLPLVEPSALVGKAWSLDLASGEFIEPPGVGGILGTLLGDFGLLLSVKSLDETTGSLDMLGALAEAGTQDLCVPTLELPEPAIFNDPEFSLTSSALPIDISGISLEIADLEVSGIVLPDGSGFVGANLRGSIDTRDLVGLVPGTEEGGEDSVCELLSGFGVACAACDSDGEAFCLTLDVAGLTAESASEAVVPRTDEDIEMDVDCDE